MVEINCQNYLNQYLDKKILFRHKENAKNLMLIVETRLSLNLILVIKNAIEKLPNFNLMLISTKSIIEYIQNIFGKISNTAVINKTKINLLEYSELLRNPSLWNNIKEDRVLVFQSDTLILRNISEKEFSNLSMLGPVCVDFNNEEKFVMNGGFSFRDKNLMKELCKNEVITSKVEDIFFTEQIRKFYPELMPKMNECNDFAIESIGNKKTAKGIHGTDKYYYSYNNFKELFNIVKNNSYI